MHSGSGLLSDSGYARVRQWTTASLARARATQVLALHRAHRREVAKNLHLTEKWVQAAVQAPRLLAAVRSLIGDSVAVENTFLVIKWPGKEFPVPWHQDGINAGLELHPDRSVAAWLAITEAPPHMGCLIVAPRSQTLGYLPYHTEPGVGEQRGRALETALPIGAEVRQVPVAAGDALLMDPRLLHCSDSNMSEQPRIGLNIRYVAPDGCTRRDPKSPSLFPLCGDGW